NTTTFVLDALDRTVQRIDPLTHSNTYAYDLGDRLVSTTDRDGRRRDFTYDQLDRPTTEAWVVSGTTVNTATYSYDAADNLLSAANAYGAYAFTFDTLNRNTVTQEPFGLTLTATYDPGDRRTQLLDSLGGTTLSSY